MSLKGVLFHDDAIKRHEDVSYDNYMYLPAFFKNNKKVC